MSVPFGSIAIKLAQLTVQLTAPRDKDRLAATRAIEKTLAEAGHTIDSLADAIFVGGHLAIILRAEVREAVASVVSEAVNEAIKAASIGDEIHEATRDFVWELTRELRPLLDLAKERAQ